MILGNLLQQSVMSFGILMIQGLVNSFGVAGSPAAFGHFSQNLGDKSIKSLKCYFWRKS